MSNTFITANLKTIQHKIEIKKQELKDDKAKGRKNKRWWNEELQSLHKLRCLKYIAYRDSNWDELLREPYEKAKREFKQFMNYSQKEKANKKFKRLNELFKSNINGFWKHVKRMQMIKQLINIPINDIKLQYEKLFKTSNFPDVNRDEKEQYGL